VQIGLVAHYAFCPRRAWLEAASEHTDTRRMAIGTRAHAASDDPARSRPNTARAMDVASHEWGVVGRCDAVHVRPDGSLDLVKHKATPVRREPSVTPADACLQLALQRTCLQEAGHDVRTTGIWLSSHSTAMDVELTDEDVTTAKDMVEATRSVIDAPLAPPPLEDDVRCSSCSHISVCLPDERQLQMVQRRIRVDDPDSQVVHLSTFGARASVKSGRMIISRMGSRWPRCRWSECRRSSCTATSI